MEIKKFSPSFVFSKNLFIFQFQLIKTRIIIIQFFIWRLSEIVWCVKICLTPWRHLYYHTLYTIANRLQIRKHFILKSFQSRYNNNVNKRGLVTLRVTLLNMFKSKASVVRIIVSGFLLVVIQSKVTECNTEEVKVMSKEERLYLQ